MKRYLHDVIKNYIDEDGVSLHVPGHKNGRGYSEEDLNVRFDVTEISGTDNLHNPVGAIYDSQKQAAKFYGAKSTYFLVNGSTCGIQAMILACTSPKDKIIMARNVHKSVYNACILGDLNPLIVYPEIDEKMGLVLGVSPKHIQNIFEQNHDVKAVVITSPTYEGIHSDIKAIADIVHQYGALLLVDEAHGAHLQLDSRCGISSTKQDADIVVHSTHKSLSALTQASMLHVISDRVDEYKIRKWLSILQSSSPSYLLMLSLEKSIYDMVYFGRELMGNLIEKLDEFRCSFNNEYDDIIILHPEYIAKKGYHLDVTKLCIFYKDAVNLAKILREEFAIQVEYATDNYLVCVFSIWNNEQDLVRLKSALKIILNDFVFGEYNKNQFDEKIKTMPFLCDRKISPKESFYSKYRTVSLKEAVGEVCLETITPYPPGIPLIMSGEIFRIEHYDYLMMCKDNNINIIGQRNKTLYTIDCL